MLSEYYLSTILTGIIIACIPLLLAAFGEMFSEQAGMINLGIEGMMLAGAFTAFYIAFITNSYTLAFIIASFSGICLAFIMFIFSIYFKINQIIVGIVITFSMQGLTSLLHKISFSHSYPRLEQVKGFEIPFISNLPIIGQILTNLPLFVFLCLIAFALASYLYNKSVLKLHIKALNYNEKALKVSNINTTRLRLYILLFTGFMSAIAGAFMAIIASGLFVPHMTNGMGYIALVLTILANGKTLYLFISSFLFAACISLGTTLQIAGASFSTDLIHMLPFIAIIILYALIKQKKID